ncbi:MAG: 30S ribosomal protein S9 [Flavobacteriales bacterium]|nr:30S ribosomal protein S9 [Flavobacteriales bacterium]
MEVKNTLGRRKTAVARVYLTPGTGKINVNGKDVNSYFPTTAQLYDIQLPFTICNCEGQYDVNANLSGGGFHGQAEALRLGIARALVQVDEETNKPLLKAQGLMTRDSRMVERKKPGQKKARKKFQFSKR